MSETEGPNLPPPAAPTSGWYPNSDGQQQWWDGSKWVEWYPSDEASQAQPGLPPSTDLKPADSKKVPRRVVLGLVGGLVVVIAGVAVFALTRGDDTNKPNAASTTSATDGKTTDKPAETSDTPSSGGSTGGGKTYALGTEANLGSERVTVFEYRKGIPDGGSPPDAGLRLDAALLRVCNVSYKEEDSTTGNLTDPFNFGLADGDDGTYDLYDLEPSPAPQPQFAQFKILAAGQCTKGWMAFDINKEASAVKITYSLDSSEKAAWKLG